MHRITGVRAVWLIVYVGLVASLPFAATAFADPSLSDVGAHRHFIQTADGLGPEIGPRLCDNPALQKAFNEFHANVHSHAVTGGIGPVAPGLHNGAGGEIVPRACSFTR
jgi:hypothetical protein